MKRTLTILLALSLAANVFLGGFLAGRRFFEPPPYHRVMPSPGDFGRLSVFRDPEVLTRDERKAFHAVFKAHKGELKANFRAVSAGRGALGDALSADPFDRAAAEARLSALLEAETARNSRVGSLMIDAFEALPPAKRKALVEEAARYAEKYWRDRDEREDAPPPPDRPQEE